MRATSLCIRCHRLPAMNQLCYRCRAILKRNPAASLLAAMRGPCLRCNREVVLREGHCSRCRQHLREGKTRRGTPEYHARLSARNLGERNPAWKGGRHVDRNGYVWLRISRDDAIGMAMVTSKSKNYVQEHRLVMAHHLGRPLGHEETVHHVNLAKADNRIENLKLFMSNSEHLRHLHLAACPNCGASLR